MKSYKRDFGLHVLKENQSDNIPQGKPSLRPVSKHHFVPQVPQKIQIPKMLEADLKHKDDQQFCSIYASSV